MGERDIELHFNSVGVKKFPGLFLENISTPCYWGWTYGAGQRPIPGTRTLGGEKDMIYKNKSCHTKETKYLILDDYYNATYTDTENLEYMNEVLWFSVSKSLFSEYKAERGFTNTDGRLTDDEIYDFIDANLSRIHKLKKENMYKLRA